MVISNKQAGFTLIELLVVVGIIGILATVVVVVLGNARTKGADSGIQSNLHAVSNQAEIFFTENGNSYLPAGGSNVPVGTLCSTVSGTNMFTANSIINSAVAQSMNLSYGGNSGACHNTSSVWSVAIELKSSVRPSGVRTWCVDSTGAARLVAQLPGLAINSGTGLCN